MTQTAYRDVLADLLSGDPDRVREANRKLFAQTVGGDEVEADLTIAAVELTH